jgi:L-lactate utilization protein LutC
LRGELSRVGAHLHTAQDPESAARVILEIAESHGAGQIIGWASSFIDTRLARRLSQLGLSLVTDGETSPEHFRSAAEKAAIGLTTVDYAIADTGTLVVLSGKGRARAASLLTPIHVAIVERGKVLATIQEVFTALSAEGTPPLPSAVAFITGPSRTADIELTLVVGVHGPQELHVILIE